MVDGAERRAMTESLDELLRRWPFFRLVPERHFDAVRALAGEERYDFGDVIVKQGDEVDAFYLLTLGPRARGQGNGATSRDRAGDAAPRRHVRRDCAPLRRDAEGDGSMQHGSGGAAIRSRRFPDAPGRVTRNSDTPSRAPRACARCTASCTSSATSAGYRRALCRR